jgi:hypothetical protein
MGIIAPEAVRHNGLLEDIPGWRPFPGRTAKIAIRNGRAMLTRIVGMRPQSGVRLTRTATDAMMITSGPLPPGGRLGPFGLAASVREEGNIRTRRQSLGPLGQTRGCLLPEGDNAVIPTFASEPDRAGFSAGQIASAETEGEHPLEGPEYTPPAVRVKSMVATRQETQRFGAISAAAWARGFYGARRKAFLGDGAENNWTVHQRWFSDFVAILDFIHVLSYVFPVAMAGRAFTAGWAVYVRWIGWVWRGRVAEVIRELEQRQEELGLPGADEPETSPRKVVDEGLNYLKNHQDQMHYDEYRRLGLPSISGHVESTVKQFNRRVKGTEKLWSEEGAEAVLQLRADYLSETEPMEKFWQEREAGATGRRCYRPAM